jgi:DNA-binding Xre family transcriptional regulator
MSRAKAVYERAAESRYSASVMRGGYCQMAGRVKGAPAHGTGGLGETPRVPKKTAEDYEAEARVRAHLRQQMHERKIDRAELARRIGSDDGNMTRILNGSRGIGLGLTLRISRALKITPTRLLEEDPPGEFSDPPDNDPHTRRDKRSR